MTFVSNFSASRISNSIWFAITLSLLLGFAVFILILDIKILNPEYIDWLGSGDPMAGYLGWKFYRYGPHTFPWGLNPNYGAEIGSSIVFSDSIPIMAMLLKSLSSYLPEPFQYLGIWYLIALILQAFFAWMIVGLWDRDFGFRFLATLLLVFSPAMLSVVSYFAALSSHFLILAAIYLCLRRDERFRKFYWALLLCTSISITFYIFVMVFIMWISDLLDKRFIKKKISSLNLFIEFAIVISAIFFTAWQNGYFSILGGSLGVAATNIGRNGYGDANQSLNLFSFFYFNGWSYIISNLPSYLKVENGFNYLGLGVIVGFAFLFYKFGRKLFLNGVSFTKANMVLVISLVVMGFFAVSNNIRFGIFEASFPLPENILLLASPLRTSSRMFWPLYYFLLLGLIWAIGRIRPHKSSLITLAAIVFIQVIDLSAGWIPLSNRIAKSAPKYFDVLLDPFWGDQFILGYQKIYRLPTVKYEDAWEIFGKYAADNRKPTNFVMLNRPDMEKFKALNDSFDLAIRSGVYDSTALYIVQDDLVSPVLRKIDDSKDALLKVDDFYVLAPGFLDCKECVKRYGSKIVPKQDLYVPKFGEIIEFGKGKIGAQYLLDVGTYQIKGYGWSYPEQWGVWSEGRSADFVIPLPEGGNSKNTSIEVTLEPFLGGSKKMQIIEIYLNGTLAKTLSLKGEQTISLNLNNDYANYASLRFNIGAPTSPYKLGLGDDERMLGVALKNIRLIAE